MRTTPQSPRSRFPKGQPRQSGNHAPNQHPPLPRTPSSSYRRKPVSRGAPGGAPPPKPPSHPQLPVVGAVREPPVPPQRDPHPTTSSPRRPPPPSSFPHSPTSVIPAKAGTQRGAARGASVPHRVPHSPSQGRSPTPFALSLSKPVLRALEGGPTTNTPRRPPPPHRRTGESRYPEGRGAVRLRPPSRPRLPVVGAVREPPVPPQRDPHPTTSSLRRPAHPHRPSRTPPRASFSRSDGNPTP